jgi:hypothetical protein
MNRIHFVEAQHVARDDDTGVWLVGVDRAMVNRMAVGDPLRINLPAYGGTDTLALVFTERFNEGNNPNAVNP